ncbi:MAG TPA: DUF4395 family protein, partial [Pseudoneobacillus sp.]|nr:DUF4395 family protein [Pseudoneobacillus sp.]
MPSIIRSIPRPLVKANQWVIVISVALTWIFKVEWFLILPFLAGLIGIIFEFNPIMQIAKCF